MPTGSSLRKFYIGLLALTVICGSIACHEAVAQVAGGAISGTVSDPNGRVIADVQIVVKNLSTGVTRSTKTNTDGLYTAPATAPTPSIVTVTAIHKDDPTDSASASVTIVPPQPAFLASRAVSISVAEARAVNQSVTATVSVGALMASPQVSRRPAPLPLGRFRSVRSSAAPDAIADPNVPAQAVPSTRIEAASIGHRLSSSFAHFQGVISSAAMP